MLFEACFCPTAIPHVATGGLVVLHPYFLHIHEPNRDILENSIRHYGAAVLLNAKRLFTSLLLTLCTGISTHLCNMIVLQPRLWHRLVCVDHKRHSRRMLLTTNTQPPSLAHTVSRLPAQSSLLCPFVWVVIGAVTLSPSFHVKYIVLSLLLCSCPHSSPSLGRCKTIPLFIPPKMPLFQADEEAMKEKKRWASEREERGEFVE